MRGGHALRDGHARGARVNVVGAIPRPPVWILSAACGIGGLELGAMHFHLPLQIRELVLLVGPHRRVQFQAADDGDHFLSVGHAARADAIAAPGTSGAGRKSAAPSAVPQSGRARRRGSSAACVLRVAVRCRGGREALSASRRSRPGMAPLARAIRTDARSHRRAQARRPHSRSRQPSTASATCCRRIRAGAERSRRCSRFVAHAAPPSSSCRASAAISVLRAALRADVRVAAEAHPALLEHQFVAPAEALPVGHVAHVAADLAVGPQVKARRR